MRILKVRFLNLNSLAGEWEVDFTHEAFASDGIFAITGPTGSGKTTILDAICLGLYGRTPRLERVTKSSNEIMSRQTGECFAEVTFGTQKGCYRCYWSQHRSRKKSTGELQQARHEIADADTGVILESRIAQVGGFIESVTGMDFERFTRSMLLAQGGFAAFLQASPDDRAPILEQITGTGIYSLISIKVHERRKGEQDKLELLQAHFNGIQVLGVEEEAQLHADLQEKQNYEMQLLNKVDDLRQAVLWVEGLNRLKKDIAELDRQAQSFEERRRAFVPDAEKLERSRKALSLEGDYREVVTTRAQQTAEIRELENTIAMLPEKEKAETQALVVKETAEAALADARNIQTAAADVIKQVREQDARLSEQNKQLAQQNEVLKRLERQIREDKFRLQDTWQLLKTAQDEMTAVEEYQKTHADDAALLTRLAVITRGLENLRELESRFLRIQNALTAAAKKKDEALIAIKKGEANHEQCCRRLEAGQIEQKRLTDDLAVNLQGREISQWREKGDELKERERLLTQAGAILERIVEAHKVLEYLKSTKEYLQTTHKKISSDIQAGIDKIRILEQEIAGWEIQVSLLSRIRDLEAERQRLEDGKACPLCGATDHPYARGNLPELRPAEIALKKVKADLKNTAFMQSNLESKLAAIVTEIRHTESEIAQKTIARDTDEKACIDVLAKLNIENTLQMRNGIVGEELVGVQAKLAEINKLIITADEIGKKEKAAQKVLENLRNQFADAVNALQETRLQVEKVSLEYTQLNKERGECAAETEKARNAVLQDLEPFGIKELLSENIDAVLTGLALRHDMWKAKQNEKISGEKKIAALQAEISKAQALLTNLEKNVTAKQLECAALHKASEVQSASRLALFGKKNPDVEEKRLSSIVNQANQVVEERKDEYAKSNQEANALKEKIAALTIRTNKRAQELENSTRQFMERLIQAGFSGEADYGSACLSEKERDKLVSREKALTQEKTELETRRKDKEMLLCVHCEKHLTDHPLATLQENIVACELDLKQTRQDIGGIIQRLTENDKQRKSRQEYLQNMDARKKECARWNDLHNLIGSADGKKFRNFAQGLTFEMMTIQANRQLRKMTDRYLLIRDISQSLELNVIDNYQAGEIRSTKNLSGGESFIVSLALALGLSHMSSRNVRVDSLFLDEGFGTLDDDALEMALETLAGLQRDGKLIGVISHVPALRERIGTQITVTPGAAGRSSLNGPGCRRI